MRVLSRPEWAVDSTTKRISHTAEQHIRRLNTGEQLILSGQARRRGLSRDRGDTADRFPLAAALRRHRSEYSLQVWAMDFQFEFTTDSCRLKLLNVNDESAPFCLAIRVCGR